jgi:hypothetical protein
MDIQGELSHRTVKSWYRNRSNKNQYMHQLARLSQRSAQIHRSGQQLRAQQVFVPDHQSGT